jgi:hypothetical protein
LQKVASHFTDYVFVDGAELYPCGKYRKLDSDQFRQFISDLHTLVRGCRYLYFSIDRSVLLTEVGHLDELQRSIADIPST